MKHLLVLLIAATSFIFCNLSFADEEEFNLEEAFSEIEDEMGIEDLGLSDFDSSKDSKEEAATTTTAEDTSEEELAPPFSKTKKMLENARGRTEAKPKTIAAPKTKAIDRSPASVAWQGFKRLKKNCKMYKSPSSQSQAVLTLKKGKRLWLESAGDYMKGFRKKGVGFIPVGCF